MDTEFMKKILLLDVIATLVETRKNRPKIQEFH
jgi:hypothetical protein